MTKRFWIIIMLFISTLATAQPTMQNDIITLSQDFVYAAKAGGETDSFVNRFSIIDENDLFLQLNNDNKKKAFFINLYNAYTQVSLKKNPEQYKNRNAFFTKKQIHLAGYFISLDKLEHGILRHSKTKWSLGYIDKLFPGRLERKLRVAKVDYRIHFALNCGAKSCPAIAYYKPEQLDEQLALATKTYLEDEAVYDLQSNTLHLPALMSWFRADFGGKRNEIELCRQLHIIPADVHPKIQYKHYDWALYLNNYKTT
ncbi:MAG: DUF547 domain-containing protein [Taibaiella sp.]|nr:DUF547 domain-containing protein [Taibaiella sp.]